MDNELIMQLLHELLYVVITVVIPIVTTYVVKILKVKLLQLKYDSVADTHSDWIIRAMDIVEDIVLEVQQTYVQTLKNKGEFTPEAAKEAKEKAITLANELIADEVKEAISMAYTSFDSWLDVQIEKNVFVIK